MNSHTIDFLYWRWREATKAANESGCFAAYRVAREAFARYTAEVWAEVWE